MKEIEWSNDYLLGNKLIDKQHQIFADLINKLIVAQNNNRDSHYLTRLIMEIQKYAEFHFISEENYMIDIEYPALAEHQQQHIMLIEQFSIAINSIELGEKSLDDFAHFLLNWFKQHTINKDKLIVEFLQG